MQHGVRTAFILGAGLGTRLLPWTQSWPKPLLQIGGRPLITHAFTHVQALGIERLIVNTHHCSGRYGQLFPDGQWNGLPITFRHEPDLLETGGGIRNIQDLLDAGDDRRLLIYNGDVICTLPLEPLLNHHAASGNEVTLALRTTDEPRHIAWCPQTGRVINIRGMLPSSSPASPETEATVNCLFTGIYVIERRFLERFTPGEKVSVIPAFLDMIREAQANPAASGLGGVLLNEGEWCDVGTRPVFASIDARLRAAASLPPADLEAHPPYPLAG